MKGDGMKKTKASIQEEFEKILIVRDERIRLLEGLLTEEKSKNMELQTKVNFALKVLGNG
jgi:hypothetical protein